ncbi:26S proteasome regulatory subunit 7-like [Chenopodium quinoa]|uniref:26S proteasome regulatory subunit 7-like n=1 Tax=Chenopodium quinoa TaxID=63459 RepID=UPI000B77E7F8|nr:26S proteasome regulatory subunit 7-like [Chenopodium quinoa]
MGTEDENNHKKETAQPLDEIDIDFLKKYGNGPYSSDIDELEKDIKKYARRVKKLCGLHLTSDVGVEDSDTGLSARSKWNLKSDILMMKTEETLRVAYCTSIMNPNTEQAKYVVRLSGKLRKLYQLKIHLRHINSLVSWCAYFNRITLKKPKIQISLPPKIHPDASLLTVKEKPDVTYNDIGGYKEQIRMVREVVELPMIHPEKFVALGVDPPKGILFYGPPGTGKTLIARAVANRTDACFIRVNGTQLLYRTMGKGAAMVRHIFKMAKSKLACILFFDEIDAVGGARSFDVARGDNEVQHTMMEIANQLDGFDSRGNIKVVMATNRPDTLDPALLRPGRIDRKVEFGLPDLEGRTQIFKIQAKNMSCERGIRFELLARLCPNCTGADIRSVCTEAGVFAIRARRKFVKEKDFLDAINKVINEYQKFSATPKYMIYN